MTLRTLSGAPLVLGGVPVSAGPLAAIAPPVVTLSAFTREIIDDATELVGDLILSAVDPAGASIRWWAVRIGGTVAAYGELPNDVGPFPLRVPGAMVAAGQTLTVLVAGIDGSGVQGPVASASVVVEPPSTPTLVTGPTLQQPGGGTPVAGAAWEVAVEITGDVAQNRVVQFEARPTSGDAWARYGLQSDTSAMGGWQARAYVEAMAPSGAATVFTGSTITVAAAPVAGLAALAADEWEIVFLREGDALRACIRITDPTHPAHPSQTGAGHIAVTGQTPWETIDPVTQAGKATKMPGWSDSGSPNYGAWKHDKNAAGTVRDWADRTPEIGLAYNAAVWYSLTSEATAFASATWSPASADRKTATVADPTIVEPPPPPATRLASRIMFKDHAEVDDLRTGDGGQLCLAYFQCRAIPEYAVALQDTGHIHLTADFGRSWFKTACFGLTSRLGVGVWMHPTNPLRMAAYCRADVRFPDTLNGGGLFTTTDGGTNWTRRVESPPTSIKLTHNNCIGHAPSNPDRMWFLPDFETGAQPLWTSPDGGTTWTKIKDYLATQIGRVYSLMGDPTDQTAFWVAAATGLWRFTSATSGAVTATRISGTKNLPLGAITAAPYLSGDGTTMIVCVSGKGIWQRTTTNGDYTRLGSQSPGRVQINPYNPDQMIQTQVDPFPKWSSNRGVTLNNPASVEKRPGKTGAIRSTDNMVGILWRQPTGGDPRLAYHFGQMTNRDVNCLCWSSPDMSNWTISMENYGGLQLSPQAPNGQLHHPSNPQIYAGSFVDFGLRLSRNGLRSFDDNAMRVTPLGTGKINVAAAAIHPNFGAGRDWIIASINSSPNDGFPVISKDGGASWARTQAGTFTAELAGVFMGYDLSNPAFAFWSNYKSSDHGETWTRMTNLPADFIVVAMTETAPLSGGQAIFAINWRGTDGRILRSRDRGASWQTVVDMGGSGRWPALAADVADDTVFYMRAPGSATIMRKYDLSSGTPTNRPFTPINCVAGLTSPGSVTVGHFRLDPHHPEHMAYLNTEQGGQRVMAAESVDGGQTWENLTGSMISAMPHRFIEILRTGDLVISGANGAFGKRRPSGFSYPNASLFNGWALPTYVRQWHPLAA